MQSISNSINTKDTGNPLLEAIFTPPCGKNIQFGPGEQEMLVMVTAER